MKNTGCEESETHIIIYNIRQQECFGRNSKLFTVLNKYRVKVDKEKTQQHFQQLINRNFTKKLTVRSAIKRK